MVEVRLFVGVLYRGDRGIKGEVLFQSQKAKVFEELGFVAAVA
jgi:hypothetical protein